MSRPETIKIPEENIGKTVSDKKHSRILCDSPPKILEIKTKINKWDLIKIKSSAQQGRLISKVKRQPSEWEKIIANKAKKQPSDWEKIFANERTDKLLTSKICKQLIQLNTKKLNNPVISFLISKLKNIH